MGNKENSNIDDNINNNLNDIKNNNTIAVQIIT